MVTERKRRRQDYNKLRYTHQQGLNEAIKRFKEQNPERFKVLQTMAEVETEAIEELRQKRSTANPIAKRPIDHRAIHTEPHYFIHTKDAFGGEHLLFENGYTPEAAAMKGQERWPQYAHTIVRIEPCSCPLCTS